MGRTQTTKRTHQQSPATRKPKPDTKQQVTPDRDSRLEALERAALPFAPLLSAFSTDSGKAVLGVILDAEPSPDSTSFTALLKKAGERLGREMHNQTLTRQLRKLEKLGLIERLEVVSLPAFSSQETSEEKKRGRPRKGFYVQTAKLRFLQELAEG